MQDDAFRSRIPVWLILLGAAAILFNTYDAFRRPLDDELELQWMGIIARGGLVLGSAMFLFAIWNRLVMPVVEIGDDAIAYGSIVQLFLPRRRIPLHDIAEVLPSTPDRIALRLRSGARREISLFEVAKDQRAVAKAALEMRLAQRHGVDVDARGAGSVDTHAG